MVQKWDGTMRFCVDYCKTNELIKKGKFPLFKIDTVWRHSMVVTTLAVATFIRGTGKQKSMNKTGTKWLLSLGRGNGTLKC